MSGLIPASELAALQSTAQSAMDLSGITLKRPSRTQSASGTYTETLTTVASGLVGGWAKPSASIMTQYAGLIGSLASWVVRLPGGTSVRANDVLAMPSGDTLRVQADLTESSYSACVRVLASEVR